MVSKEDRHIHEGCKLTNHPLVDRRANPVVVLAVHDHLGDLESSEIRQTELDELALLVQLVQLLQRLLEGHTPVRSMEVEDINAVRTELLERLVQLLLDHLRLVGSSIVRVPLGGTGKSTLLPLGLAGEGFLLAADVDSGGVDLVVAGALEAVEDLVVVVDVGDAGAL
jgi:hypothetical protein